MLHFHTWKDPAEAAQATCHHQQRPQNFQGFPSTEFLQKSKNVLGHYPPSSTTGATGGERAQAKRLLNPRAEPRLPRFTLLPTLPEMKAPGSVGRLPSNPKAKHQQTGKTELGEGRMCRGGEFLLLSRIRPAVSPPFSSRHPRDLVLSPQGVLVPQGAPPITSRDPHT